MRGGVGATVWVPVAMLLCVLSACDDDRCIDGVCPDFNETRALPGPCRSAGFAAGWDGHDSREADLYEYDAERRVSRITHEGVSWTSGVGGDRRYDVNSVTQWTYDAAGEVAGIEISYYDPPSSEPTSITTWEFASTQVIKRFLGEQRVYDRGLFAFSSLAGNAVASPAAELGLVEDTQLTNRYLWTIESPLVWVKQREGGPWTTRYLIDDRRQIVTRTSNNGIDPPTLDVWTYEDGRLVIGPTGTTYHYDRGGNIVEIRGTLRTVHDYSCW